MSRSGAYMCFKKCIHISEIIHNTVDICIMLERASRQMCLFIYCFEGKLSIATVTRLG